MTAERTGGMPTQDAISLRDYFAAKAMAAIIANPVMEPEERNLKSVAELAYDYADWMLKAKDKE